MNPEKAHPTEIGMPQYLTAPHDNVPNTAMATAEIILPAAFCIAGAKCFSKNPISCRLLNQFREGQLCRIYQLRESVPENAVIAAVIEPKFKLIQIGVQMLHAHLMIRPDNRPLQEAPDALYAVCVNVPANPFLRAVANALMARVRIGNAKVCRKLVRVDRLRVRGGVVQNELVEIGLRGVRDDLQPNLTAALNGSDGDGLVSLVSRGPCREPCRPRRFRRSPRCPAEARS
jgi:hypothetical protein